MKGHTGARKDDKSITTRLTPDLVLASAGTAAEDEYMPVEMTDGSYTLLYRIWGSHQKYRFQNKDMGYLEIKKELSGGFKTFTINKVLVNNDNLNLHVNAKLKTLDDEYNTPVSFNWDSSVTDNALCTRPELSLKRQGSIESGRVVETIKGNDHVRGFSGRMVFDFTVYDLVMRNIELSPFTYYENMYSFKPGNRLFSVDKKTAFKDRELRSVIQTGTGLTERIFYIDENRIPIIMVQNSVVYILDTMAREKIDILKEELNAGGIHYEY